MRRIIHEIKDGCERWVVLDDTGAEHEVYRRWLTPRADPSSEYAAPQPPTCACDRAATETPSAHG